MNRLKYLIVLGAIYVSTISIMEKSSETIPINRISIVKGQEDYLVAKNQRGDGHSERLPRSTKLPAIPEYINGIAVKYQATAQTIAPEINYPPNYLLIWTADWCPRCPRMKALGDKLKNEGFDVFYIDFDSNREQAKKDKISRIPVAVVYATGKETKRVTGISQRTEVKIEAQIRGVLKKNKKEPDNYGIY